MTVYFIEFTSEIKEPYKKGIPSHIAYICHIQKSHKLKSYA